VSALVELREEATPAGPFRLPRWTGADGMLRRRGGVLVRLLHLGETPVLVRSAQSARDRVVLSARSPTREGAAHGISRLLSGGDPRARAEESQVREFFAPYGEWAGLAATHMCAVA